MSKHIMMRYPEGRTKALTFSYDDGTYTVVQAGCRNPLDRRRRDTTI